ncbi:type II toxin-antitoxin system RelE/ParE family toxin [Pseudomonadota bacterium]
MYKIVLSDKAEKSLNKLDKYVKTKILKYLKEKIEKNPTDYGKPLTENLSGLWRYRVGDYRIITKIINEELTVLVVEVGHRREVYK